MDTSPLTAKFLTELQEISPAFHSCLTTSATLPSTVSPAEIAFFGVEALRMTQNDFNSIGTGPFLSAITRAVDSSPTTIEGHLVKVKERSLTFNEVQGPIDVLAPTSTSQPPVLL